VFIALFSCSLFYGVSVYGDYDITSNYRKTEFNSTKWIQAYHNCILNTTTGLFYLNKSEITPVYDDFTSWIESDTHNRLSQTSTRSTFINLNRIDDNVYLYDTKTDELADFTALFQMKINSIQSSTKTTRMSILMISNILDDFWDNKLNGYPQFGIQLRSKESTTQYYLGIIETTGGNTYVVGMVGNNIDVGTLYYVNYTKRDNVVYFLLDDDNDFSSLIYDYQMTLQADYNLEYMMIPQSIHYPNSITCSGYAEYLNMGEEPYYTDGVLYTKDLLENTTLKSLMIGINGTAQANTQILLYGSPDNSTWKLLVDNSGLGELMQHREILYNYSSLYVRLNLTTSDTSLTPFVDELFYLHTYECVAGSETKPYVFIILFTIIGMLLGYAVDRT